MTSIATAAAPVAERPVPALRAVAARAGRDLLYLTIGLATSVVAFAVWLAGLIATGVLLPFVVGLPVALGVAAAVRWTATLDRRNAVVLDSHRIPAPYRDHAHRALGGRLRATFGDPQTWRDLAWLMLHSVVGFGFGVAAIALAVESVGLAVLPLWYWALPDGVQFGLWTAGSLPMAALSALLAVPLAALTVVALRGMAALHGGLARWLLGPAAQAGPSHRDGD